MVVMLDGWLILVMMERKRVGRKKEKAAGHFIPY
jgi:hypothetical protein